MEKIDRLGWAAGMAFKSYGLRIGIRTNRPEILETVPEYLPPGWKPAASPVVDELFSIRVGGEGPRPGLKHYHLLYFGGARTARTLELKEVFERLESDLQLYVAVATRQKVFVHAGVVAWKDQAILIPGRSFSGKTTLVAALVRAGATYYSDEYAVLDPEGRVHPYAKRLFIRDGDGNRVERCAPESLGGRAGRKPLQVGLVVLSKYKPGAQWRPRTVSPGRATLEILNNTAHARTTPEAALAAVHRVVSNAVVVKGTRGEADEVAASVLRRLQA